MTSGTEQDINAAAYACHKASALLRLAEDVAESFDAAGMPPEVRTKGVDLRDAMTVVRELISREIYALLLAMQEADARGRDLEKTGSSSG